MAGTIARTQLGLLAAGVVVASLLGGGSQAHAATTAAKTYANCTAVQKAWSGGIAKPGVKVNLVTPAKGAVEKRKLKGTVKFDKALYAANSKLDRDKDGIACEKS
ncbi:excalibur calcium-binding domain-containing protein [Frigoribacterium sp. ACAM 257]|uniref:excalibur calcium-binding domain-containing protein n=1 Tax=Frigoribacterium sp. ACAM 257 TaxID=2508998 RepID=UPI0011BA3DB8|nr:excalibur calcium-binding domain-containing protein [Frigoribacterium sp. ACAM 257]TWX35610.1 excalibur calcium-binding domain-containing protein [Frigoribacterium sp. ACAM 257]